MRVSEGAYLCPLGTLVCNLANEQTNDVIEKKIELFSSLTI